EERQERFEVNAQIGWKIRLARAQRNRLSLARPKPDTLRSQLCAKEIDRLRPDPDQMIADAKLAAKPPMLVRASMGRAVNAEPPGFRQGGQGALIRLDTARTTGVHQNVIGVRDDHLVTERFKVIGDPF